jgi:uridine kinase
MEPNASDLRPVVEAILVRRSAIPVARALLVAVSGIDGSGKGYITARLVAELNRQGRRAVGINVDGWLNLPARRFSRQQPAEHFYHHAIRFDELFAQLILPLKRQRSIRVEADIAEETAHAYRRHLYEYHDVDVIVLEGIYLLKRDFLPHYDWKLWLECSFETALDRALKRGQEGLPSEETICAYQSIYFPAQEIHFQRDQPRKVADMIWPNASRLDSSRTASDEGETEASAPP